MGDNCGGGWWLTNKGRKIVEEEGIGGASSSSSRWKKTVVKGHEGHSRINTNTFGWAGPAPRLKWPSLICVANGERLLEEKVRKNGDSRLMRRN